jgi:hypothetical protein
MSEVTGDFLTTLSLDECISRLKSLPRRYFKMRLDVLVEPLDNDNYRFEMRGKGASKNTMDMTLYGHLKRLTATSTQVSVKEIVPGKFGYYFFSQYLWVTSPFLLLAAILTSDPRMLLAIPLAIMISLLTPGIKQLDKDKLLAILYWALERK